MNKIKRSIKKLRDYIIILPAYNEQNSISQALDAISAADSQTHAKLAKVIVCINGCTDKTEEIVKSHTRLPILIIRSTPGYLPAMNKLLRYARKHYPDHTLVKTDADSTIDPRSLSVMFEQLDRHPEIMLVGSHPLPRSSKDIPWYQKLSGRMLSIRNRYPLSEMAVHDVTAFHTYTDTDPQPGIGQDEKHTKIYFHGRLWCAVTSKSIPLLHNKVIGDDVYIGQLLHKDHGYKSVRIAYGANCYFRPYCSIARHWKVYKRIHEDKERVRSLPGFEYLYELERTKLNWRYILTGVPLYDVPLFFVYSWLRAIEEYSYGRTAYKKSYWQYAEKEA